MINPSVLRMARTSLLAVLPALSLLSVHAFAAHSTNLADHGTFEIFSAGKSIGTETFEIRVHSDRVEATGEDHLQVDQSGKTVEVDTTSTYVLDSHLNPISYAWAQKGAQSSQLSVDFRSKPAHARYKEVNGKEEQEKFKLDNDVVVLDDNVIHHYELALDRYDQAQGGPQVLNGFVPQEAQPGVIILNYAGLDQTTLNGSQVTLRHFVLAAGSAQINLWADDQGRLQIVSTADLKLQARRKQ